MAYTFDPTLPSLKDQVRLRLQDTDLNDPSNQIFQDETILAMLGMYSYDEACAQLAESAGVYFAQEAESVDNGPVRYIYRGRADFYMKLSVQIRSLAQPAPGAPVWTGATGGQMCAPDLRDYRTD
jgi:hypothetical protein